jgi:hypothetical protein
MVMKIANLMLVLLISMMAGCASVPMASAEKDAAAKTYAVKPDKANIYIYRNENFGAAIKMPVAVDGRLVGDTASKTYLKVEVTPGNHTVTSKTENDANLNLQTIAGKNYFVWQEVKMGMWAAGSQLQQVDDATGKAGVDECKLIEGSAGS